MKRWFIELKSGAIIPVRDENVDYVNGCLNDKKPIITKNNGTIMPFDIVAFDQREDLLEEAAKAFGTPIEKKGENGETMIATRAVKKFVSHKEYASKYSRYRKIGSDEGGVWVAWYQPVHMITNAMVECSESEEKQLKT